MYQVQLHPLKLMRNFTETQAIIYFLIKKTDFLVDDYFCTVLNHINDCIISQAPYTINGLYF